MILDALFGVVLGLIELIVGLVTSLVPAVPAWFVSALSSVSTVTGYLWAFDAWIPVGLMLTIAGAVFAGWVAGIVIGGVRWIVSYFFGGGGAT